MTNRNATGCPVGAMCFACRATDDLRAVIGSTPYGGPLCWTACPRCARGGVHLRLTTDATMRLVIEHRAHGARTG